MLSPHRLQAAGAALDRQRWIFARTMPHNPHWYTLRREWQDDAAFVETVMAIREGGYDDWYHGRCYRALNVNGWKYWTMGAPIEETILINRKPTTGTPHPYDAIAASYDAAFDDPDSQAENRALMAIIGDVSGLRVLDIGCGTGLLLDYLTPRDYVGIDPSGAMLAQHRRKHPRWQDHLLQCRLEEYAGGGFDLAVALFGVASYIHPLYVAAIPALLNPGGRYVLMFYRDGYEPVTYERCGVTVEHSTGVPVTLPGTRTEFGHFIIVDGRR